MKWPDITGVLSPVPFAVVGAVATRLYMPERFTQDLGIIIAQQNSDVAQNKLIAASYKCDGPLTISGNTWLSPDNVQIDILEGDERWWPDAISAAQLNRDAQGLPILPLPYLVLMKYRASRVQDIADISRMLGQSDDLNLNNVRELFTNVMPGEIEDLESLIKLGQMEYE